MKALGIDPGTGSMDLLLIEDEDLSLLYEESIPRIEVTRKPDILLEKIEKLNQEYGIDTIAAPSGYGIPFTRDEGLEEYILEATFVNKPDLQRSHQIHGLRKVMLELSKRFNNVYYTPGVIHLSTVPVFRKYNKIDMGTADKVFTVAAALYTHVEVLKGKPDSASFIVVEAGKAYNSAIAVENGKIIDGVGGTSGGLGFLGLGCMDSELAYTLCSIEPSFSRHRLFQGGVAYIKDFSEPEDLANHLKMQDHLSIIAAEALAESIIKDLFQLIPSFSGKPEIVYLSGRLFRTPILGEYLERKILEKIRKIDNEIRLTRVHRLGKKTKEGATGAAILASGYAGGRFQWVVETLRLQDSRGSIFQYIIVPEISGKAKSYFRSLGRDTL